LQREIEKEFNIPKKEQILSLDSQFKEKLSEPNKTLQALKFQNGQMVHFDYPEKYTKKTKNETKLRDIKKKIGI